MLKRQTTYYIIILLIGLFSCGQNDSSKKNTVQIILPDSSKRHEVDIWYRYVKNLRRELNLKDLEIGTDSFELRLYEDFTLGRPERLFIIKNEKSIWTCTIVIFFARHPIVGERRFKEGNWKDEFSNSVVDSFYAFNVKPKCRWDQLADSLKKINIFNLPSQEDIPNFEDIVSDGTEYYFEIATKDYYKFFSYHNPEVYKDKDNKSALAILELISRQLSPVLIGSWGNGTGE